MQPIETIRSKKILVKGQMKSDENSYFVKIPQEIKDFLDLKGEEHFVMMAKIKGDKKKINLKLMDMSVED